MVSQDQPAPSPGAVDTYETEHFSDRASEDRASEDHSQRSLPEEPNPKVSGFRASTGLQNVARRTLGITLLLITVILWTVSNFLASVSDSVKLQKIRPLIVSSTYSRITHIQSHTLSPISTRLFLPFR